MKYISCQPEIKYFAWQLDVMLFSFENVGINLSDVHILCSIADDRNNETLCFSYLEKKYPGVVVHRYKDDRPDKTYIPSIKHQLLYKHYDKYPDLKHESVFFHDSDIVFTKNPELEKYESDDIWYLSDTVSYIGYDYILSKGRDTLETMLITAGIEESLVSSNQENSGGAQYIIKNVDAEFWKECRDMGVRIYKMMDVYEKAKARNDPEYHKLQVWTAEMWATIWNAWKHGIQTKVDKGLDFCWATCNISKWDECSIYHNAGVVDSTSGMFYKGQYINVSPFDADLDLDKNRCSILYYKTLKEANRKNY
tara:strand:- start:548 stop:1474 length:927 start_codon:yes stop_codon:yes gene_type:complete